MSTETLYTLGYGLTKEKDFIYRLCEIAKELGRPLAIIDVRKDECRSRNGKWCYHPGEESDIGIAKVIKQLGFFYTTEPSLANVFPNTKAGLRKYADLLTVAIRSRKLIVSQMGMAINRLVGCGQGIPLLDQNYAVILMCAERKPYKDRVNKAGEWILSLTPNCHRVILADQLTWIFRTEFKEEWQIEHR